MTDTVAPAETVVPEEAAVAEFFDGFAAVDDHWRRRNRGYFELLGASTASTCPRRERPRDRLRRRGPPGRPATGGRPRRRRERGDDRARPLAPPGLEFVQASGERLGVGRPFDYIVLDLVPYAHDLVALLENLRRHAHARTRVIVNFHSQVWRPVIRLAEILRLKARKPLRNWVSPSDIRNVLELAGFEPVTSTRRILLPKRVGPGHALQRLRREHLAVQPSLPDLLDRRPAARRPRGGAVRLRRLPLPERRGQRPGGDRAVARDGEGDGADLRRRRVQRRHARRDRAADRGPPGAERVARAPDGEGQGAPSGSGSPQRGTTC